MWLLATASLSQPRRGSRARGGKEAVELQFLLDLEL